MKKVIYGLSAVALAIGGFAFTKANSNSPKTSFWYFQFTTHGVDLKTNVAPTLSSVDPYQCDNSAITKCDAFYTSYTVSSGVYTPVGFVGTTKKTNPL